MRIIFSWFQCLEPLIFDSTIQQADLILNEQQTFKVNSTTFYQTIIITIV